MDNYKQHYPHFMRMVDLVSQKNPLQKKRIQKFLFNQDISYWKYAEFVCQTLSTSFLEEEMAQIEAATAFNRMSMDFLKEQIRFSKTGVYSVNDASIAKEKVYEQPDVMRYYMIGLLISYLLWPNHYKMLSFYKKHINRLSNLETYLEIAPGHGLFTVEMLNRFKVQNATLVDISQTSIQITGEVLSAFKVSPENIRFFTGDFLEIPFQEDAFDFISMGEVIEHVNDALLFLKKAGELLKPNGNIFMTTCANCPAIDHVYHFHDAHEIRALIDQAGLVIAQEGIYPIDAQSQGGCYNDLVPMNYCAILTK